MLAKREATFEDTKGGYIFWDGAGSRWMCPFEYAPMGAPRDACGACGAKDPRIASHMLHVWDCCTYSNHQKKIEKTKKSYWNSGTRSWIFMNLFICFLYYVCLIDGKCRSMEHDIVPMIGTLLIGSWVILTGLFPRIEPWVLRVLGSNIPMICHSLNKTKSSYSWFYLFCSSLMGTRQKKYGWIWLIAYASGMCSYETSLEWWELHRGMV